MLLNSEVVTALGKNQYTGPDEVGDKEGKKIKENETIGKTTGQQQPPLPHREGSNQRDTPIG